MLENQNNGLCHPKSLILFAGIIFFIFSSLYFFLTASAGTHLLEFGDESEKFVAAQMIANGMHLYRDIFAHHGPFPYLVSHFYTFFVSPNDFSYIRWFVVFLALCSAASVFTSPALKGLSSRLWAVGLYLCLLSSIWITQAIHMLLYHQIGGFLLVIPITQVYLPILLGETPKRIGLIISGMAVAIACFTAYAFGPTSVLLVISTLFLIFSKPNNFSIGKLAAPFILGSVISTLFIIIWMLLFADIKGFYIYHFFFNQIIYSEFIAFNWTQIKNLFLFSFQPTSIIHSFVLVALSFWVYTIVSNCYESGGVKNRIFKAISLAFFILGVFFLNPRGNVGFHDSGFIIANLALLSFSAGLLIQKSAHITNSLHLIFLYLFYLFVFEEASEYAISTPHGLEKKDFFNYEADLKPSQDIIYKLVRSTTNSSGDILSLIFNPSFYIRTDRLPVSGHFYYLPWQAAYNKNSVDNYNIDICKDINEHNPSVIWFDNWKVWDKYSVHDYEPCVPKLINKSYHPIAPDSYIYFRNDIWTKYSSQLQEVATELRPSPPLSESKPITIHMSESHKNQKRPLKSIGIRYGTHIRTNPGFAELHLQGNDGADYLTTFNLSTLKDNKYRFYELDGNVYTSGNITYSSGGGVSTWESYNENGEVLTCVIYEYVNGMLEFTPGCPHQ